MDEHLMEVLTFNMLIVCTSNVVSRDPSMVFVLMIH